jgi:hypothetical protein
MVILIATPSRLPDKGYDDVNYFLAAKAMSAIKELSTLWKPSPAWWKK